MLAEANADGPNGFNQPAAMELRNYLTCLWPGLSELWWCGRLSALPQALGFAVVFNAMLVLKYLYPTWLDPTVLRAAWWVGVVVWICWTIKSVRELPALIMPRESSGQPDRFPEAQAAYLRADWELAESLLMGVLSIDPRDPPALLLLSGVYRHTDRWRNALALLNEMSRLELSDRWEIEMEAEVSRIQRLSEGDSSSADSSQAGESPSSDEGDDAAELTAA